jgi:hypothetical protein
MNILLSDEIEKVYDLWRNNNENGIINKENINKIIFENIMHYTRKYMLIKINL